MTQLEPVESESGEQLYPVWDTSQHPKVGTVVPGSDVEPVGSGSGAGVAEGVAHGGLYGWFRTRA